MNRDRFDIATGISGVIGLGFHEAMKVYYGGSDFLKPENESEAIQFGLTAGMDFLNDYQEAFIRFSATISNKQTAFEKFTFVFNEYVKTKKYEPEKVIGVEEEIEGIVEIEWHGRKLRFPIQLKGFLDRVDQEDGKIKIRDYKTCSQFSNPEKIDGAKMLQAVEYYLLAYFKYGVAPYSLIFEEVKYSKNKDGSPQVREYEIIYAENPLYFDFYFRFYEDMLRAFAGEQVYVPNVHAIFDNEVAIIAYIHRLDVAEDAAKLMKENNVTNITDLLKKEIQSAGNMRQLMKAVEEQFVSAKSLNYESMTNEEKIQTKLLEYGMILQFDSKREGASVDLYCYTPTIGLKMSKLKNFVADVEQVLGVSGIRVLAPIPNTTLVGFEVPRKERTFPKLPGGLGFYLSIGQTIMGEPRRFDIRQAPHLLVAGASGSGKSVFLGTIIEQISKISGVQIHLFDPKIVELAQYQNLSAVVEYKTDAKDIDSSLKDLIGEMNARYKCMAAAKKSNISEVPGIPYKFVVIDEFGDLTVGNEILEEEIETGEVYESGAKKGQPKTEKKKTNLSKEISKSILILSQKARAAGIHLIIATQRPSVDVITGTIKANFSTKAMFRTAKLIDSKIVIDQPGAEALTGKGDMLFASDSGIERLQGYSR